MSVVPKTNPMLLDAIAHADHEPAADWRERAACLGADRATWFPERGASTTKPKLICASCPVRLDCAIDHANEKWGIFGGLSERERRVLKATMRASGIRIRKYGDAMPYVRPDDVDTRGL